MNLRRLKQSISKPNSFFSNDITTVVYWKGPLTPSEHNLLQTTLYELGAEWRNGEKQKILKIYGFIIIRKNIMTQSCTIALHNFKTDCNRKNEPYIVYDVYEFIDKMNRYKNELT